MAVSNDPFEEFEFRPINEGLGFHRKQKSQTSMASTQSSIQSPIPVISPRSTTNQQLTSRPAPASFSAAFSAPLPRNETSARNFNIPVIEDDSIARAQTAVNEILKNLNQKRQTDYNFESERQSVLLKKSKPFFFAAALDAMLITAAFLLSMIAMLLITKIDLFMNLSHAESSKFIYVATIGLFLAITFIYMVVNRAFTGFTPGEWAFDQCCGQTEQMNTLTYIPRLAFRTILVMATGFVTLPVLSYLFNKDVAGQIAGVVLFRHPNA